MSEMVIDPVSAYVCRMELNADCGLPGGEIDLDEARFRGLRKSKRGRAAAGKVPVLVLLERGGREPVRVAPVDSAATLLKLTVEKVRRGRVVVYTGLRP